MNLCTHESLDTPTRLPLTQGASLFVAGTWLEARSDAADAHSRTETERAVGLRSMDDVAREKRRALNDVRVSMLAVACKRCVVLYRWVDGAFWDCKVHSLPRTPKTLALFQGTSLFAGYAQYEYVRVAIRPAHASSVAWRTPPSDALTSGTWTDTAGWDTYAVLLPTSATQESKWWSRSWRPLVLALEHDVLVSTMRQGVFVDAYGRPSRKDVLEWDAPPLHGTTAAPYLVLHESDGTLGVYMQTTLRRAQSVKLPSEAGAVRFIAAGPQLGVVVCTSACVAIPNEVTVGAKMIASSSRDSGSLYVLEPSPVNDQLAALTSSGNYHEALALLDALDPALWPHDIHNQRLHIQALVGLASFVNGKFDVAVDLFIDTHMNPTYVLALYPETISGPHAQPPSSWATLFDAQIPWDHAVDETKRTSSEALDALARYLSDCRRVLRLKTAHLKHTVCVDTHCIADLPMCACTLDKMNEKQLMAMAQVVDTALFHVFLQTKPALLGPMCRVDNWCDVERVRPHLEQRHMFDALVSLYRSKQMHAAALELLQSQREYFVDPIKSTIDYLEALGPEHLDLILLHAHWVLDMDPEQGMCIFTSESHLESLPPDRIAHDLASFRPPLCLTYLERVMEVRCVDPSLHTLRACLYLDACRGGASHAALLEFLCKSTLYDVDAVLHRLPDEPAWPEIRAVLLGRLGRHDEALRLYLVELRDIARAEAYCVTYARDTERGTLLSKLLRIARTYSPQHLHHVYAILTQHAQDLNLGEVLALLPQNLPVQHVYGLLERALQAQTMERSNVRVIHALCEAQVSALDQDLRALQQRHVLVTEGRTCVRCHRRLGQAVLAVMPATGATMHYYCAMDDARDKGG